MNSEKEKKYNDAKCDPLQTYGIGIVFYRDTLFLLSVLFCILALLSIPMCEVFKAGGAIQA